MKRVGYLYEKMLSPENWSKAIKGAIRNKKSLFSVKRFLDKGEGYAEQLRQDILNGSFKFLGYNTKKIYEPKERTLYIARLEERFFHWACMLMIEPIFEPTFHYHSYSCRKGKGQHKASLACAEAVRKYKYVLDIDAAKFYPSIPHDRLKLDLAKKIKDKKFLEDALYRIIDSHHTPGRKGYGVPIGNYSSQIFGNIYMTKLDNFCNNLEGAKRVLRYCDNSLIFFNDKELAKKAKKQVQDFYRDVLDMRMSKCELYPTTQGVDFVGYRHFRDTVLVRKRTAKRIDRRMRKLPKMLETGRIGYKEAMGKVASAIGWTKHAHSKRFVERIGLYGLLEGIKNELKQSA